MAELVKHLTLAFSSDHDLTSPEIQPLMGSSLTVSVELSWDSVSLSLSASLPTPAPALSLSKQTNKLKKKFFWKLPVSLHKIYLGNHTPSLWSLDIHLKGLMTEFLLHSNK